MPDAILNPRWLVPMRLTLSITWPPRDDESLKHYPVAAQVHGDVGRQSGLALASSLQLDAKRHFNILPICEQRNCYCAANGDA